MQAQDVELAGYIPTMNGHVRADLVFCNRKFPYMHARMENEAVRTRESRPVPFQREPGGRGEDHHLRLLEIGENLRREYTTYEDHDLCQDLHVL